MENAVLDGKWVSENVEWIDLTPELAARFLDGQANNWRALSKPYVTFLAREMKAGRWQPNAESIKFNADGKMVDGQHRCAAVIESATTIRIMAVRNIAAEEFDRGQPRRFSQHVAALGIANPRIVSQLVFSVWKEKTKNGRYWHVAGKMPTVNEMEVVMHDDWPIIQKWAPRSRIEGIANGSWMPIVFLQLALVDSNRAERFHELLATGAGLPVGHPILQLRERLLIEHNSKRKKLSIRDRMALIVKAWNLWISGETVKILKVRIDEEFPEILAPKTPEKDFMSLEEQEAKGVSA